VLKKPSICCFFFIFTLKVLSSIAESEKLANSGQPIFLFENDEWTLALKEVNEV